MKVIGTQKIRLVLVLCLLINIGKAMKYCKTKEDCLSLGDLECIKTKCDWGLCSCPRGKVSRYLGSEKLYMCVSQKKVGESCSTDGDGGVCGAQHSMCVNGTCECAPSHFSRFGGEVCAQRDTYASETLTGSATSCVRSTSTRVSLPASVMGGPLQCVCPQGQQTYLPNSYGLSYFQGKKFPTCRSTRVGDFCIVDGDCRNIQNNAVCRASKCACKNTSHVADITGLQCGPSLKFGDKCYHGIIPGICSGSQGLTCGTDVCDLTVNSTTPKTCVCHHTHIRSGTTCQSRKLGEACYGDENCKGINMNTICVEGKCQNGATTTLLSVALLLVCAASRLLQMNARF